MLVPSATTPASRLRLHGMTLRVLAEATATERAFGLVELEIPEGAATPMHRHARESETVVVRAGAVRVHRPCSAPLVLEAGDCLVLPAGLPHRLEGASPTPAVALAFLAPGGLEATLALAATPHHGEELDPDDVSALLACAGVTLLGFRA